MVVQAFKTSADVILSIKQHNQNFLHIPAVHSYQNTVQPGSLSPSPAWQQVLPTTVTQFLVIETECVFCDSTNAYCCFLLWAAPCGVGVDE